MKLFSYLYFFLFFSINLYSQELNFNRLHVGQDEFSNYKYLKYQVDNPYVGKSDSWPEYSTSYLKFDDRSNNLFLVTGSGKFFYFNSIIDFSSTSLENLSLKLIKNNLLDMIEYEELIGEKNSFGV